MELKTNLAKAIIAVMQSVKGIDKTMTIGTGNNSYKGVSDKEVKKVIGDAMAKNGLCIIPIDIESKIQIDRWDAPGYNNGPMVTKQSVFTEVKAKYILLHESGESIEISGYGHGIDAQDKGAGKATTYALKYALMYTFMIPTGTIDDEDAFHSYAIEAPKKQVQKPILTPTHEKWKGAVGSLRDGKVTIDKIAAAYSMTNEHRELLILEAV